MAFAAVVPGGADRRRGRTGGPRAATPTPAWVFADRDAGQLGELGEFVVGVGVEHAATGDDQRAFGGADGLGGTADVLVVGVRAADPPFALGKELLGHVEGFGLDVLGQRNRDRAGLGRVGEDTEAVVERGEQLLGPGDAVEKLRQRPEGVIDGDVVGVGLFELLQHGVGGAGREVSLGSSRTGSRFVVASAAPVSRFEEPGPIEVLIAKVWRRRVWRAKPTAWWDWACSLRPW